MPPRRVKRWTEAEIAPSDEATIALLFERLFALEPNLDEEGDPRPRVLKMTPEGKRMPKLSPFGPVEAWREVGRKWTTTPELKKLQQQYPEPPLIIFLSNNEHAKLRITNPIYLPDHITPSVVREVGFTGQIDDGRDSSTSKRRGPGRTVAEVDILAGHVVEIGDVHRILGATTLIQVVLTLDQGPRGAIEGSTSKKQAALKAACYSCSRHALIQP